MGSIPHIYRREGLSPGDPAEVAPNEESHIARFTMGIDLCTKLFER